MRITPDTALACREGALHVSTPTTSRGVRLPVDHLFRSLAHEYGGRAVGIVLSGAGSDGSDGIRALRAAGGLTIVQEPATCGQSGMPRSAMDTGAVDLVLPVADMGAALARYARLAADTTGPAADADPDEPSSGLADAAIARLAGALDAQSGFDLRAYKPGTIRRRVLRRMALAGFEDPTRYIEYVESEAREQQALIRDLLISVTDFFRDAEAFAALRSEVLEPLVQAAEPGDTLRAWVPGCATGEEAYSMAIEFLDAIEARGVRLGLQVFATDIDQEALGTGRAGSFPAAAVERVGEARLEKYFAAVPGGGYQVVPRVRDVVSFAPHDLTRDPPFSRMHLVSCRNLLIYLRPETQAQVLGMLHFALLPDGCLFLGSSESTGTQPFLFATLSKRWRLYRKVGPSRAAVVPRTRPRTADDRDPAFTGGQARPPRADRGGIDDRARRAVIDARVPPGLVVGASGRVVFMHGELRPYLRFPRGEPRLELADLVSPELATRVRAALYRSRRDRSTVIAESSPEPGTARRVRITASPVFDLGDEAVLLTFETVEREPGAGEPAPAAATDTAAETLERELLATREDLRNTIEELEASNEELRSSSEESTSMNEELQSANEELEATTEELRSLNEEL
ncbi:MAG: CheR family methyltransferase, partial [Vicinamibacterales bacterium]